jgi:hypothetical protein
MRAKSVIRLSALGIFAGIGVLAAPATGAFAQAITFPAAGQVISLGGPPPPGSTVSASCPSAISTDSPSFVFISGNGVSYGPTPNPNTFGGNIEGTAIFEETDAAGNTVALYEGHAHLWFGQNVNVHQGQNYSGNTVSFQGSGLSDPSQTLSINGSFGDTTAAHNPAPTSGWFHLKVTC